MIVGTEWLVEAAGCDKAALRDEDKVRSVLDRLIADLGLMSVGSVWHKFEGEGGVTGLVALTESHIACHTYPEYGIATFNFSTVTANIQVILPPPSSAYTIKYYKNEADALAETNEITNTLTQICCWFGKPTFL